MTQQTHTPAPDIQCPCPKCGLQFEFYYKPELKAAPDQHKALLARKEYHEKYGFRSEQEKELHIIELSALEKARGE